MRTITIPVEVKLGTMQELGLFLSMEGVSGTDEETGRKYEANPAVGGTAMSFLATDPDKRHAYAKVSFRDLIQQVWTELATDLDSKAGDAANGQG